MEKKITKVEKKEIKQTIEVVVAKKVNEVIKDQVATLTSKIVLLEIERDGLKHQLAKYKTMPTTKPIV